MLFNLNFKFKATLSLLAPVAIWSILFSNTMATVGRSRPLLEKILIDYRWIFVCFFLLPASFVYNLFLFVRNWLVFRTHSAPHRHAEKVAKIQRRVREWRSSGSTDRPMCTARPGWQTMSFRRPVYKRKCFQVECNLVDVLHVDQVGKRVRCEPLVTMGQLSATLEPLGWTLPIVPELDDLTIGGLVMGTGLESSSHHFGLFQHICLAFEVVLADGELVRCTENERADLFRAIPWSYGTLGLLTAVELRIRPASGYVHLRYEPVRNGSAASVSAFQEAVNTAKDDFVEALQFNANEAVIMRANMIDRKDVNWTQWNDISRWYKPWFFTHVEQMLAGGPMDEYMPLRAYHHRHSRALFWELQDIVPFGNHWAFRWILGWMMPVKVSLLKITQTAAIKRLYESQHMIQDFLVPLVAQRECLQRLDAAVQVYPLWLCPFWLPAGDGMVHPLAPSGAADERNIGAAKPNGQMYVDIGVYGVPKRVEYNATKTHRDLEDYVAKVGGFQMLYADTFRTRKEFRHMFDHRLYDRVRREVGALGAFPDVYDKVSKAARD